MRIDTNILGAVRMPDAGGGDPAPTARRYGREDFAEALHDCVDMAKVADEYGYDTLWFTEHHFQYEGYEVVPNQVLLGMYCAAKTERISFGQQFNIVPNWNPLRLAEDFATADVLTGGRMRFGVGRGTVPRETMTFGAQIESGDNKLDAAAEEANRALFAEQMEVITKAFGNERFSHQGTHYSYPPPGIPDRGGVVTELTLVPNVLRPVEIYQACTSPRTMKYVAEHGHVGVYLSQSPHRLQRMWRMHAEFAEQAGRTLAPGAERQVVLSVTVGDTHEEAVNLARPGHDELVKFLSPYGRYSTYDPPAGRDSVPYDHKPSLEESIEQRIWAVGTAAEVAETIEVYRDLLGMTNLCIAVDRLGMTPEQHHEQLRRFATRVGPLLGVDMAPAALASR